MALSNDTVYPEGAAFRIGTPRTARSTDLRWGITVLKQGASVCGFGKKLWRFTDLAQQWRVQGFA